MSMTVRASICLLLAALLFPSVGGYSKETRRISRLGSVTNSKITFVSSLSVDTTDSLHQKRSHDSTIFRKDLASHLHHSQSLYLQFTAFDTPITLYLTPNHELFHPTATFSIFDSDNDQMVTEPLLTHDQIYKGHVVNAINDGHLNPGDSSQILDNWARIVIRHDIDSTLPYPIFEGAFANHTDIYHIKTRRNFHITKRHDDPLPTSNPMVIYRESDFQSNNTTNIFNFPEFGIHPRDTLPEMANSDITCAMEDMLYNRKLTGAYSANRHNSPSWVNTTTPRVNQSSPTQGPSPKVKRRSLSQGCPTTRKVAYMGVAADCSYVQSYGGVRYARLQIINDWNIASAVFERTFNVALGLMYIQMSTPECPERVKAPNTWNQGCSSTYTINDRLSDFSLWRGKKGDDNAALWHLMTRCSTGAKVGIAWLSQLCQTQVSQQIGDNGESEWVSGAGVSSIAREEWKVVAHEIAHGFGAIHDCTDQSCPCISGHCSCCPLSDNICSAGATYLMNPTSNVTSSDFSPCSISDICGSFPNIGYCLESLDQETSKTYAICGNGILEPGEECDSGMTDSPCCYAKTCRLKAGAICDDYSQQCCLNCAVAPSKTLCRPSASECDIPEYCTGESLNCPADGYYDNGSSCANGTMNCASGVCTSRSEQCMARGMRLNINQECPFQKDSCQISCADPADVTNCLVLTGVFLDGTKCGLNGFCEKGVCVSTGSWNTFKAWVDQNKQIAIPVFLFGGLFILAGLGWLTWFLMTRYRRRRMGVKDKDSRPSSISSYRARTAVSQQFVDAVVRRKSVTLQTDTSGHRNSGAWELETMGHRQQ